MKTIKKVADTFTGGNVIATSITSSSTNNEVAGAKAVYDNSLDVYSTTEQVVGTWIDGKPLYRRIMTGTIPSTSANGTYANITSDIADNIDFAYIELQIAERTDNIVVNFPRVYASFSSQAYAQSNCSITSAKKLQVSNTTTELNAGTYYVWVNYTKTTDTATTNSLNTTRLMNSGSLVGMGNRVEINEQVSEQVADNDVGEQTRTEVSENEVSGDQIEEKETEEQAKTAEAVSTEETKHED